jgi:hypothetical protein
MGGVTRTRLLATGAGFAVLIGAVVMLVALVAAPGPWLRGYVSEAGTSGQPFAVAYRWGLLVLALGVALLSAAFAAHPRTSRSAPLRSGLVVAVLLGLAALPAGVSAVVPCSDRCPLPPFEPTTVADVVHTAASIVGMILLALAMLAACVADLGPALRRLSVVAAAMTVPMGLTLGLTMLLAGRGTLGASLERMMLVVAVSWLIGTSLLTVLRNSVKVEPWNSKTASQRWRPVSRS